MAEAMLLGVAKSVLGQLSSPAVKEALLVWNFEKDLKRLGETIETITCFIYDAEQRQSKERLVKLWLSRLKAVLYDADDLFDAIAARDLHKKAMDGSKFKKEVTLFFSKSNQLAFVIKTAHDIKGIRECLDGIKDDLSQFQFQYVRVEENLSHRVLEREERHSFVDSKAVIGRDQEKEDIITLLLAENTRQRSFEVISVIGFGGLGKTTLAQLVYNDQRVQKDFDLCLWSCINYLSDLESVLVKILTSALNSKPRDLGLDQLQRVLREKIGGKKYLLVLDDVWDDNLQKWGRLETLLGCGKIGSKVLITTRKVGVAKCLQAVEPFYKLGLLSEECAWSLFVKVAFKDEGFVGDSELASLGKQIIRKCGYSPLLVSLIGGLLGRRKKDSEVWGSFLEKEFAGVVAGDTGDGNVMQVLEVSYNDLPAALKRCFAYCSVFPEDHEFDKDVLVHIWIAQGFVEPVVGKSLKEVGDGYFFSMIDTCFFQEVQEVKVDESDFGVVIYTCKMHDLLHELATQVAGSGSIRYTDENSRNMDHLRHISITPPFSNSLSLFQNLSSCSKSLRSLVTADDIQINSLKLVLEKFRNLRTLVLQCMDHTTLPDSFGGLIHLRYLDLSHNSNLIALPKSICKLHHLQTLSLTYCRKLAKFPTTLKKLASLRHLFLKGCKKLDSMPSGLTSLVSLDCFIMHPVSGGLRYLQGLDMLCGRLRLVLPVKGWTDCVNDAKEANMASKGKLSGLSIKWKYDIFCEEELEGEKRKAVVDELQPHVNLRYLEIVNYTSDKLPRWFSLLSNLKNLSLASCTDVEYLDESVRCDWLLPHLEVLELHYMECLRGWCRGETSTVQRMLRLSKLVIEWCRSLVENMPLFDALEDLTLEWVNVKLVNMLLSCPNVQCSPGCHNSKLQVVRLSWIEGLECLPEGLIKHLTALKDLHISDCEDLRWISRRGLACLTSLEALRITRSGDVRLEDEDDDDKMRTEISNNMYGGLQRLRFMEVPWHRDLYYGLRFLTSLQELKLTYYEEQQVEADNRNSECRTSAPDKLQRVCLYFKEMRKCCFPKWTLHLPCLQELTLRDFGEMNVADWVAQQTQSTTLVTLLIDSYVSNEELLWVHDIPWNLLPSLRTLEFKGKLSSIPDGIQHLTSLQRLDLWGCWNLGEIPNWMKNLTSLRQLSMGGCSLELKARCTPQTGADWHLISHIPYVLTKGY